MTNPGFSLGVMVREVKRPTFEEALERIHGIGFECAQLNLNVLGWPTIPASIPAGKAGEIGASFWAYGLNLAAISGTFNTAHPDENVRKTGIAGIRTLCESAEDMGTQVITICTGTRNPEQTWRPHPDNASPEAWKVMISTLRALSKIAAANSVLLAFEPEMNNIVNTVDKAVRLLDEISSDNLKVLLDPTNLLTKEDIHRQSEIFEDAFTRLSQNIILVHIKDFGMYDESQDDFKHVPVGKGNLDSAGFLRLLKTSGYQGPIILHNLPEEEMPSSLEFISNTFIKA